MRRGLAQDGVARIIASVGSTSHTREGYDMAIGIGTEQLLTLRQAAKRLPGRPHLGTLWRWYSHGVRGQRLETILIGGRRYTSAEALERFAAACSAASDRHLSG